MKESKRLEKMISRTESRQEKISRFIIKYVHECGRPPKNIYDIKNKYKDAEICEENGKTYKFAWDTYIRDSWNNVFHIERDGRLITLLSAGPDGKFGSDDDLCYDIDVNAK